MDLMDYKALHKGQIWTPYKLIRGQWRAVKLLAVAAVVVLTFMVFKLSELGVIHIKVDQFKRSQSQHLSPSTDSSNMTVCLVTAYAPDPALKYPELVVENHRKYASKHGYHHVVTAKRMVEDNVTDHWNKIAAINRVLYNQEEFETPVSPDWIVWLDSDAVVLDFSVRIEDVIAHYRDINPDLKALFISHYRKNYSIVRENSCHALA